MAFNKNQIAAIYQNRAKFYNLSANLYYLVGLREFAYRKMAVQALDLKPGDTVVEMGCGTGLNFGLLQQRVGDQGRIIGVDLTPAMLAKAQQRIRREGWINVSLIHSDAAAYRFPQHVDGIITTFALTLVPDYDQVIQNGASALPAGKRLVVLDFKKPERWPAWLIRAFAVLTRPFGVTLDLADRHPWESVRCHMHIIEFRELYCGGIYICVGGST